MSNVPSGDLKTIAFIASYLGVTPRSVRTYISKGLFPAYRILGTRGVRLRLSEVVRSIKAIPATRVRTNVNTFGPHANIINLPAEPERRTVFVPAYVEPPVEPASDAHEGLATDGGEQ
jgi:hypothetical protein